MRIFLLIVTLIILILPVKGLPITELRELPEVGAKINYSLPRGLEITTDGMYSISGEVWIMVTIKWDFIISKGNEKGYIKIYSGKIYVK